MENEKGREMKREKKVIESSRCGKICSLLLKKEMTLLIWNDQNSKMTLLL